MDLRLGIAKAIGAGSTFALKRVFRRPAANFPGKAALYADSLLIGDLRQRLRSGSVVVAGTNGKTTVTNLLADALQAAGFTVACNRTGANLDSGIATSLLQTKEADWGVFECDELWLAKVVPQLRPRYVLLLNLFRDQLDRMGEIEHIQASIAEALDSSPGTVLVYNCDDPLCQAVADRVVNDRVPFGVDEDLGLAQNAVADAGVCQRCESPLYYRWRQYGQLGAYLCPACGFERARPVYAGSDVRMGAHDTGLMVRGASFEVSVQAHLTGSYTTYNLLAVCAAADCCGVPPEPIVAAVERFTPRNGRLQRYRIDGCEIVLNLAKNPTGFNQNLRIIENAGGPKAVAFFINDREADGHDVSWLWDVDFQELACDDGLIAYAGGSRRNDLQVRLKYAGIEAELVDDAADFLARAHAASPGATLYLIANYTALPAVKAQLDHMRELPAPDSPATANRVAKPGSLLGARSPEVLPDAPARHREPESLECARSLEGVKLTIAHVFPELLNLYGDGGNVTVLAERARLRGAQVSVVPVEHGSVIDLSDADLVFLGGGPDREQRIAARHLIAQTEALRAYVEDDGVLLAICGGYQILGRTWLLGDESVKGLGILDIETQRAPGGSHNRLVGNVALDTPFAQMPVIGYENHAGRTFLGPGCQPFGHVKGRHGKGNNGRDGTDGALYRNVVGTYLHGPLLAKNPEIADHLIALTLSRQSSKLGEACPALAPLDDAAECAANAAMCAKLGIRGRPATPHNGAAH